MTFLFSNSLKKEPRERFYWCYAAVRQVVRSYNIEPVAQRSNKTFCALSFYVDRAIDTKMIGCHHSSPSYFDLIILMLGWKNCSA